MPSEDLAAGILPQVGPLCVRPANGGMLCLSSTVTCPNDALPGPAGGGANAPTLRTRDRCQEMTVRTAA